MRRPSSSVPPPASPACSTRTASRPTRGRSSAASRRPSLGSRQLRPGEHAAQAKRACYSSRAGARLQAGKLRLQEHTAPARRVRGPGRASTRLRAQRADSSSQVSQRLWPDERAAPARRAAAPARRARSLSKASLRIEPCEQAAPASRSSQLRPRERGMRYKMSTCHSRALASRQRGRKRLRRRRSVEVSLLPSPLCSRPRPLSLDAMAMVADVQVMRGRIGCL